MSGANVLLVYGIVLVFTFLIERQAAHTERDKRRAEIEHEEALERAGLVRHCDGWSVWWDYPRDSDAAATAVDCGDNPVPKDRQARAQSASPNDYIPSEGRIA